MRCNERMKNERQRSFRARIEQEENSFSGLAKPERIVNRDILISTVHYPPFPVSRYRLGIFLFFPFGSSFRLIPDISPLEETGASLILLLVKMKRKKL